MTLGTGALVRWFKPYWRTWGHEHRSIIRGMILVGGFAVLGKLASAAKEIGVAWRYGVSAEVDAYLFVFNLVNLPVSIWAGVLGVVLLPLVARIQRDKPEALRHFQAELLGLTLVIGIVLALLALLGLPALLGSGWVGLPPRTVALARAMVPVLGWVVLPGLLAGLFSVWMMSAGRHLNTLLEGLPALGILVGVLITGGIEPLIWGTLVGTILQVLCLAVPIRQHYRSPAFTLTSTHWAPFWQGFGVMLLGQVVLGAGTLVDQFFAARLGEGVISSIGYANRLLALILGIGATALTRATLPVFSRSAAEDRARVRSLALRWSRLMALAGVLVVLAGWLLSPLAVRLLFQRGTFTAANTEVVAHLLRVGLLQIPFYFASLVLVSLTSSAGRYGILLVSGVLGLVVKVAGNVILLPHFGVAGLMLSSAMVYGANSLLLVKLARQ